jgi:hypothetical protein
MKPLGRKPLRFPGKKDYHPQKPFRNWWEVENDNDENKVAERQLAKREIIHGLRNTDNKGR